MHEHTEPSDRVPPIVDDADRPRPNFQSLSDFLADMTPLSYVVDKLVVSGSLYTLTGKTGVGKTTLLVTTALATVTGREEILGRRVTKGRVAIASAENPDGLRRMISVAARLWNIDRRENCHDLIVSKKRVRPEELYEELVEEAEKHGPLTAVFVDTFQAFYDGQNASNPTEAHRFIARFRPLTAARLARSDHRLPSHQARWGR